jgi:hypothetical protein
MIFPQRSLEKRGGSRWVSSNFVRCTGGPSSTTMRMRTRERSSFHSSSYFAWVW